MVRFPVQFGQLNKAHPSSLATFSRSLIKVSFITMSQLRDLLMVLIRRIILTRFSSLVIRRIRRFLITLLRHQNSNIIIAGINSTSLRSLIKLNPNRRLNIINKRNIAATIRRYIMNVNMLIMLLRLSIQHILLRPNFNNNTLNSSRNLTIRLTSINSQHILQKSRAGHRLRMQLNRISLLLTLVNSNRINRRRVSLIKNRRIRTNNQVSQHMFQFRARVLNRSFNRMRIVTLMLTILIRMTR